MRLAGYRQAAQQQRGAAVRGADQELAEYWRVLEPTFVWTAEQRQRAGYAFSAR